MTVAAGVLPNVGGEDVRAKECLSKAEGALNTAFEPAARRYSRLFARALSKNTRCGSAHPSAVDWQLRLAQPAAGSEPDHASSKGRSNMPLFMYQAAYTPESWAAQLK